MSRYWQSYWYQVMCTEDRNPGWKPLHSGPLHQVPNKSLVTGTLADWVVPVLEDAADEIDWISGEIRIDCYTDAVPAPCHSSVAIPVTCPVSAITGPTSSLISDVATVSVGQRYCVLPAMRGLIAAAWL
ncbi:hypothetical protein BKG83_22830 [Mycobacteroides chelonae]|jgi:hypothetical protein|nr:hypothetical protein BKG83_22830 [Mycobacteroides chelonae]PKQ57400.1 hypothetical protein B5566_13680 [Mycobacterium sp. MHSD3]SKN74863.1 Uncharacterised protein [Mycobacteroides abscessus subsp. bolletii]SKW02318.1 Uncharacterised protein [Mycobacteroides abscessus subsp. massiliense]